MPDITRRIRLPWAYYNQLKRELYDTEDTPFSLKVRMLKAEVMDTLRYGCGTRAFNQEQFAALRTAHHELLRRMIGLQRPLRTDHLISYANTLKKAH